MNEDSLIEILSRYGMVHPEITFIRHNENRTFKVDNNGKSYLFRVHQPVTGNLGGLQHTYNGLMSELQMLEVMAAQTDLIVQQPIRNDDGDFITEIFHDGKIINCSLLTWIEGKILSKEDVAVKEFVTRLGTQTAKLHQFFQKYSHRVGSDTRLNHGIERNAQMLSQIERGVDLGIIFPSDFQVVEESIHLINSRIANIGKSADTWGIIHADLNMNNIIVAPNSDLCFIDFGLSGFGHYLFDVAMGALLVPSEHRRLFLNGYYGDNELPENMVVILEGFILLAIFGYYAFQMENEQVHPWIRERMPRLCANRCLPYLSGERIFYNF